MKLPKNAERVFKGVIFDIYQWEQEMFDGSTETFERILRPDLVCLIATVGDKIMVLDQEQPARPPFISLPGGRMDMEGETPLDTAKRELRE